MSSLGNKQIMADNILYYMNLNNKTRNDLCHDLGFKYTTLTGWLTAEKYPRIDKIEMMANYFEIIEESNAQLLTLINKQRIQSSQYFPVFGFSKICQDISNLQVLKKQQSEKINILIKNAPQCCHKKYNNPNEVFADKTISQTNKTLAIICAIMNSNMDLESVKDYLQSFPNKRATEYRKILCAYGIKQYS